MDSASDPPVLNALADVIRERLPAALSVTRAGDGLFVDVNDHMAAMLGYTRAELLGKSVYALGIWREPPREDVQKELREQRSVANVELTFYHRDGSRRQCVTSLDLVVIGGQPCVLAVSLDITALRAVDELRMRLLAAVETADDAIMTIDREGRFLTWNKGAERLFGYRSEELVGKSGSILIPAELPDETQVLAKALGSEGVLRDHETRRQRKDGTRVDVSVTIGVARDPSGQMIGYTGVMRDITQRKRAEEDGRRQLVTRKLVRRILRSISDKGNATLPARRELGATLGTDAERKSIEQGLQIYRDMGCGALQLTLRDGDRFEFEGDELLEVTPGAGMPTCQMALGFLESLVAQETGHKTLGAETRCQSQAHTRCVFVIRARPGAK